MGWMRGGMEFGQGSLVPIAAPASRRATMPLRWRTRQHPRVRVGEDVEAGGALTQPDDPQWGGDAAPMGVKVEQIIEGHAADGAWFELLLQPIAPQATTDAAIALPRTRRLDPWLELIRLLGPWDDRNAGTGLVRQLQAAKLTTPRTVMCIGVDAFAPYPTSSSLLASFPEAAVEGLRLLGDITGAAKRVLLCGPDRAVAKALGRWCRRQEIRLRPCRGWYPAADPTVAIRTAAPGRPALPAGRNPMEQRVIAVDPWTVIRLGRWLLRGRIDMVRPVFVGWPQRDMLMTGGFVWPRQPVLSLHPRLAAEKLHDGWRILAGHPLQGRRLLPTRSAPHEQIGIDDDHLVTLCRAADHEEASPCVACSWCEQVCPTSLRPAWMYQRTLTPGRDRALARALSWCVDCGLCTYVCPSRLPLGSSFTAARQRMDMLSRSGER